MRGATLEKMEMTRMKAMSMTPAMALEATGTHGEGFLLQEAPHNVEASIGKKAGRWF